MSFLKRTLTLSNQDSTLMTSFNLSYFDKSSVSKYGHIGVRVSTYDFGWWETIQSKHVKLAAPDRMPHALVPIMQC